MKTKVLTFNQLFSSNDDSLETIIAVYKNKINNEIKQTFMNEDIKNYTEIYFDDDEWTGQLYVKHKEGEVHFSLKSSSLLELKELIINRFKNEVQPIIH